MPKKQYGELEAHIIRIFRQEGSFRFQGSEYRVVCADKPRPHGKGECKTDVYVQGRALDSGAMLELKISVKSEGTQEFQENKIKQKRAEELLGGRWQEIIQEAALSRKDEFESRPLLYASKDYPVKPNSITLGWKLELANKPRALSARAPLTDREVRDYVYKGMNQTEEKRDARVGGTVIPGSGVAEYLLVTSIEKIDSTADVIAQMRLIDEAELSPIYLIFTANNYRTDVKKADGKRPLAVWIEWDGSSGRLKHRIHYDQPLEYTGGGDVAKQARKALDALGCRNITDLDPENDLDDTEIYRA